jgi:hypothetical protein
MTNKYGPRIVTDGLVLALDAADKNSYLGSGNTWFDLSGNNNGTLINGVGYNANNGGSLVFDGINDYVSINSSIGLNPNKISLSCWIMFNGGLNSRVIFCGKGDGQSDATTQYWLEKTSINFFTIYMSINNIGTYLALTSIPVVLNTWYNIVAVFDGFTLNGYINGIKQPQSTSRTGSIVTTNTMFSIGRIGTYGGLYTNCDIPICQIYNIPLSDSEILQNFNATKGRYGL